MFTGPVGPDKVFFYWPIAVLGNFYCPEASGSLLASSPVVVMYSWLCLFYHKCFITDLTPGAGRYIILIHVYRLAFFRSIYFAPDTNGIDQDSMVEMV